MAEDDKQPDDLPPSPFLTGGPSSMGKTETARAMAREIFGQAAGYQGAQTVKSTDKEELTRVLNEGIKAGSMLIIEDFEKIDEPLLIKAARTNDIPLAEEALAAGEDINAQTLTSGNALHIAANGGNTEMCRFLVQKGIDLHQTEVMTGYSALHKAMRAGHENIAVYLAMHGSKLAPPDGFLGAPPGYVGHNGPSKEDGLDEDAFTRLREKVSAAQIKRAKSIAAARRRPGK